MTTIDEYLRSLDRRLAGPARLKTDLLREARDGLHDAAEAYAGRGLESIEAQARAVADFGSVGEVAPAYQAELSVGTASRLTLRFALLFAVTSATSDLMWRGAPWAMGQPKPGYLLLARTVDWLVPATVIAAVLGFAALRRAAGRGSVWGDRRLVRGIGLATLTGLALNMTGGVVIYAMTVWQWHAAMTWPPMLIGGVLLSAGYGWLGRSAHQCLATAR